MSNKYKCTYCREYGNLPCEECDKKEEERQKIKAMSNTKFIKVETIDRTPDKSGEYICSLKRTHKKKILTFSSTDKLDEQYYKFNVDYFLQEVPDRESELIEMLEKVIHNSDVPHYLLDEAKELIQSVKQPK